MKKYNLSNGDALEAILNKMLEKYGVNLSFILANQEIEKIPWYQYYTFTMEEYAEFKDWTIAFLRTECTPKISKKMAEKEYAMFDLMYGLKII